MNILIPQLKKVKLYGFYPLFDQTIEFEIDDYLFLILGGNGLGKTTILQAIIYALAGPSNENIENKEFKSRRWGRAYFKERLNNSNNASVEVTFQIGTFKILLKRGFLSDKILEFFLDDKLISNDKEKAEFEFEALLISEFGYSKLQDFNFIIHKLCYLSEKRENLAWDIEAQVRILMQVFSDTSQESLFRSKRETLKLLDSKVRHKNVDINYLKGQISLLSERLEDEEPIVQIDEPEVLVTQKDVNIDDIQNQFLQLNEIISTKQSEHRALKSTYSAVVNDVEELRDTISEFEKTFFFEQLNKIESNEAKLAIHKLVHKKLCPCCGTKSETLHKQATEYLNHNSCPLCGTIDIVETNLSHPAIEAQLSEKLNLKIELEKNIIALEREIESKNDSLNILNNEINQNILNRKSEVIFVNKAVNNEGIEHENLDNLTKALKSLEFEYNDLQIRFNNLRIELDQEYGIFNDLNTQRTLLLSSLYEKYASKFLGIPCSLEQIESDAKFLNLKLFVPSFNNKVRKSPDSCSEAQRFFLDIAFRMALIDLISQLSNFKGSFICETPENALDITYIENVSTMFQEFSLENKNTLLMTSNVQSGGIAETLLSKMPTRKARIKLLLNLIQIGRLSSVQSTTIGRQLLDKQIDKILGK